MSASLTADVLDPVRFTIALCQIESTTYNEGAVGDYLADFLADAAGLSRRRP